MKTTAYEGMAILVGIALLTGCWAEQSEEAESKREKQALPTQQSVSRTTEAKAEIPKPAPPSFIVALPDGGKVTITLDMAKFRPFPEVDVSDIQRACRRALTDPQQGGVPLAERSVKVLVGVRSAYFDGQKWVRYKHEPEPVFKKFTLSEIGTVRMEPRGSRATGE